LVVALIFLVFISYSIDRIRLGKKGIATGWITTSFMVGYILAANFYGQYLYSAQGADKFTLSREREEVFMWLNGNTFPHSVVATLSSDTNRELLLYTHNRVFIPNGLNTIASEKEIWDRAFRAAVLFDLDADEFARMIRGNDSAYYLFSERFTDNSFDAAFRSGWVRAFPDALIEEKTNVYASYAASDACEIPYLLDYALVDARARMFGANTRALTECFERVYDTGVISIYKRL
jgi:hypothetical protein